MGSGQHLRTLIFAPHCDDEAISCGGLIQHRINQGYEVHVISVFGRVYDYGRETVDLTANSQEDDFRCACHLLKVKSAVSWNLQEGEPATVGYYKLLERVEKALARIKPVEVVGPCDGDLNQDHRHLHHALSIALRPINLGSVRRRLSFQALDGNVRTANYFIPLSKEMLGVKQKAIASYSREARGNPSPRSPDNVEAMARIWGSACGVDFAEGYRAVFERE
jgi:LmbE family N-acetylglucosaminyl deacetylase